MAISPLSVSIKGRFSNLNLANPFDIVFKEFEDNKHILVTNSLAMRREWFKQIGGTGFLPTEAKKGKSKEHEPVLMIGSEILNPKLWAQITSFMGKA